MIIWSILLIPSLTIWRESLVWIVFMSWYANWATHLDSYTSAKK